MIRCFTYDPADPAELRDLATIRLPQEGWEDYGMLADVAGRGLPSFCAATDAGGRHAFCTVSKTLTENISTDSSTVDVGWAGVKNRKQVYLPRNPGGYGAWCRSTDIQFNGQIVCKKIW